MLDNDYLDRLNVATGELDPPTRWERIRPRLAGVVLLAGLGTALATTAAQLLELARLLAGLAAWAWDWIAR